MATVQSPVVRVGSTHRPLAASEVLPNIRNYRESSAATVVTTEDAIVVHTGAAANYTLPATTAVPIGKVFTLVNQGSGTVTIIGGPIRTAAGTTVTTVAIASSLTFVASGTQYRKLL